MNLTPEHLRASYEIYMKYGNSSSATIISVLNKLRESEGKENVVACAFGPGIALEMMILRRRRTDPTISNGTETNGSQETGIEAGLTVQEHITNGNGIPHMNGTPLTTNGASGGNGHSEPDSSTAAQAGLPDSDGNESSGRPVANGGNGGDIISDLPVEELD